MMDWRALFVKYAQAVVDDDYIVGLRCLEGYECDFSQDELDALVEIHKEVWPEDWLGPWDKSKFGSMSSSG